MTPHKKAPKGKFDFLVTIYSEAKNKELPFVVHADSLKEAAVNLKGETIVEGKDFYLVAKTIKKARKRYLKHYLVRPILCTCKEKPQ